MLEPTNIAKTNQITKHAPKPNTPLTDDQGEYCTANLQTNYEINYKLILTLYNLKLTERNN